MLMPRERGGAPRADAGQENPTNPRAATGVVPRKPGGDAHHAARRARRGAAPPAAARPPSACPPRDGGLGPARLRPGPLPGPAPSAATHWDSSCCPLRASLGRLHPRHRPLPRAPRARSTAPPATGQGGPMPTTLKGQLELWLSNALHVGVDRLLLGMLIFGSCASRSTITGRPRGGGCATPRSRLRVRACGRSPSRVRPSGGGLRRTSPSGGRRRSRFGRSSDRPASGRRRRRRARLGARSALATRRNVVGAQTRDAERGGRRASRTVRVRPAEDRAVHGPSRGGRRSGRREADEAQAAGEVPLGGPVEERQLDQVAEAAKAARRSRSPTLTARPPTRRRSVRGRGLAELRDRVETLVTWGVRGGPAAISHGHGDAGGPGAAGRVADVRDSVAVAILRVGGVGTTSARSASRRRR